LNNQSVDEGFYLNVKDLHSNEELLQINNIKIISIEVGLWSPLTWG